MENTLINAQEDCKAKDESLQENKLVFCKSKSKSLAKRVNLHCSLFLNVKRHQISESCIQDVLLQSYFCLDDRIPKRLVTLDEKYLLHCLEFIYLTASKPARCNISENSIPVNMGVLCDSLNNHAKTTTEEIFGLDKFIVERQCPMTAGSGSVATSPVGQWIIGSIMGSKSMINILNSPLFHRFGISDGSPKFSKTAENDIKGLIDYDFVESPGDTSIFLPKTPEKAISTRASRNYGSSTKSMPLDKSTEGSAALHRGMLQCTWKNGLPQFVFSADDQNEVYVANLLQVKSAKDKVSDSDYIYLFHSGKNVQDHDISDNESNLTGKMTVSTSVTLGPNSTKIAETEFVLFGGIGNTEMDIHTACNSIRKNKGLSKKVADILRTSHLSKQRSVSIFGGSKDHCLWEPSSKIDHNPEAVVGTHLLGNNLPPNFQLAAIIVKEHLSPKPCHNEVGGWGLKFLNKVEVKKPSETLEENSTGSECFGRNSGDCSTSMDILIPAGVHGGPRMRNGGPSTLTERWKSGGHCDCDGWDMGCYLTVLKAQLSNEQLLPQVDMQGECSSFDIYVQGSECGSPTLRMVNIRNGLYLVHFQPNLSSLQSFSIAVAIIHSRSPTLKPRHV